MAANPSARPVSLTRVLVSLGPVFCPLRTAQTLHPRSGATPSNDVDGCSMTTCPSQVNDDVRLSGRAAQSYLLRVHRQSGIVDHPLKELCRVYVSKTIDCHY